MNTERIIDSMAQEARERHGEHPPARTFKDDEWRPYCPDWQARQLTMESELSQNG
jgi:hypothetical protein